VVRYRLCVARRVARIWETRKAYKILVRKPEGKRSLGRFGRRWEDDIKMDVRYVGREMSTGFVRFRIGTSGGLL